MPLKLKKNQRNNEERIKKEKQENVKNHNQFFEMEIFENRKIHGTANQFEFLYFCKSGIFNVNYCVYFLRILSIVVIAFGQNLRFRISILQFNFMVFLCWLWISFLSRRFINPKQSHYRLIISHAPAHFKGVYCTNIKVGMVIRFSKFHP